MRSIIRIRPLIARSLVLLILLSLPASPRIALAESLVIPDISSQPENTPDDTPRPARAMTMEEVRAQFGSPNEVIGPVGSPPITRWVYNTFVVTFESEYVIQSVARRNR